MKEIKEKFYTHLGIPMIIFLAVVGFVLQLSFVLYLVYKLDLLSINVWLWFGLYLFISVMLFLGLLTTYNITILIDDTYISIKLGIGLIKKKYKIADLKSCRPIITNGIGISSKTSFYRIGATLKTSNSKDTLTTYNVTGKEAIELRFLHKKTVVHIGTYQADEISQYVQSLIEEYESKNK
jgi:hypothetical protein